MNNKESKIKHRIFGFIEDFFLCEVQIQFSLSQKRLKSQLFKKTAENVCRNGGTVIF
jgi:hypothetical protein